MWGDDNGTHGTVRETAGHFRHIIDLSLTQFPRFKRPHPRIIQHTLREVPPRCDAGRRRPTTAGPQEGCPRMAG